MHLKQHDPCLLVKINGSGATLARRLSLATKLVESGVCVQCFSSAADMVKTKVWPLPIDGWLLASFEYGTNSLSNMSILEADSTVAETINVSMFGASVTNESLTLPEILATWAFGVKVL